MHRKILISLLLVTATVLGLVAAGCGDLLMRRRSAWDNLFRDNNAEDMTALLAKLPPPQATTEPQNSLGRPLLAAVKLGTPPHLLVHDVSTGNTIWEKQLPTIDSRPLIRHDLVLYVADRNVHAVDLQTGNERWRFDMPEGWTFRGAAVEGGRAYLSIGKGRLGSVQRRDGRIECLDAASGTRMWSHEVPFLLAAPAAQGGLVFVPWDGQNVTILDGATGNEVARLRSLDDVIHFVSARPEGVFYGARGLYRLTEASAGGRREQAAFYGVPMEDVPGDPEFELSGFELPSVSMRKIRYFWAPEVGGDGEVALVDGALYLLYFRFVLAFDATSGQLRWAYRFSEDIEGVHVVPGGLYVIGRHGVVTFVGAQSGDAEWESEIGVPIRSVTFSLGGLQPPERRTLEAPNVRQRLQEVIFDPDNRLLPIRTYALSLLTQVDDPEVTQDLLDITSRDDVPDQLREAAAQALGSRDSGAAFLIDALAVHHDYLSRSRPVPLNIVSRTLTQMEATEAVPALLEHLMDHETSVTDLREVAAAVVALGDASVVGPLRDFLVRYHRDSAFAENAEPLNVMADGLLRHGHVSERELLQAMSNDPNTVGQLREHINQTFADAEARERAEQEAIDAAARAEAQAAAGPTDEEICQQQRQEHYQLTQDEINQVMRANAAQYRDCFIAEMERNEDLSMVRIVWLISSDGEGLNWDIVPQSPTLLTCLLPHLRDIQFPCIRAYRQRARFGVTLRRPRAEEPTPPPGGGAAPPDQPAGGGWGPPPPGTGTGTGTPTTPDAGAPQYPDELPGEDQYPDELPE